MRVVIQLVKEASVTVSRQKISEIGRGLLVLTGFEDSDSLEDMEWIARKIENMRIFADDEGKMNRSVIDIGGEVLFVSQFTLYASTKKGNRPSFINAAAPDTARALYNQFMEYVRGEYTVPVAGGEFAAMMDVALINDGPVTIIMDSKNRE